MWNFLSSVATPTLVASVSFYGFFLYSCSITYRTVSHYLFFLFHNLCGGCCLQNIQSGSYNTLTLCFSKSVNGLVTGWSGNTLWIRSIGVMHEQNRAHKTIIHTIVLMKAMMLNIFPNLYSMLIRIFIFPRPPYYLISF